jgi:MGT family glycosyltransferase
LEQVFTSKGDLNVVYTTHNFNGDPNVNEPEYLFAGPSLDRSQNGEKIDFSFVENRTPIYISLGSLNTDYLEFYKICISAFRDTNYYVFMSIGKKCEVSQLGEIPSNFHVENFLPQLEILEHVKAFITHAGFNSVNEALFFGVPMLALPLVNDQYMVAKRITSMQLGISGNMKEISANQLRDMLKTLLTDNTIKHNVMLVSQEMKNSMNLDLVAEKMEEYAKLVRKDIKSQ